MGNPIWAHISILVCIISLHFINNDAVHSFKHIIISSFGHVRVMVTDPVLVKHVLLNNHIFDKNLLQYQLLGEALGGGINNKILYIMKENNILME